MTFMRRGGRTGAPPNRIPGNLRPRRVPVTPGAARGGPRPESIRTRHRLARSVGFSRVRWCSVTGMLELMDPQAVLRVQPRDAVPEIGRSDGRTARPSVRGVDPELGPGDGSGCPLYGGPGRRSPLFRVGERLRRVRRRVPGLVGVPKEAGNRRRSPELSSCLSFTSSPGGFPLPPRLPWQPPRSGGGSGPYLPSSGRIPRPERPPRQSLLAGTLPGPSGPGPRAPSG